MKQIVKIKNWIICKLGGVPKTEQKIVETKTVFIPNDKLKMFEVSMTQSTKTLPEYLPNSHLVDLLIEKIKLESDEVVHYNLKFDEINHELTTTAMIAVAVRK